MSPGAKVFLALAGVGAVIGVVMLAGSKNANASPGNPKPQVPGSNQPPDVIVPEPGQDNPPLDLPGPPSPPQGVPTASFPPLPLPSQLPTFPAPQPILPQAPQPLPPPQQVPSGAQGATVTLPNPLGGPPLGTFNPATGNVFGPNGVIIGTFNPATGVFTSVTGQSVPIPGFGPGGILPPLVATLPPLPGPPPPAPAAAPASAQAPATPPPPPAIVQAATQPTQVSADTASMVAALLAAETRAGWNATDPTVGVWQKNRPPLVVDSKFGPKTALTVANELGTIPIIRFWPLGTAKNTLLSNYKMALLTLADQVQNIDPARAAQLRLSAAREQAQAFSTKGPLAALPAGDQLALTKVA